MYVVTFRIANKTLGGRSYQDRYDALNDELRAGANGIWFDTTSFYVVGSAENTYEFGGRLAQHLNSQQDMLFGFDPEDMSAFYFGNIEGLVALKSFFPRAKKLE